MKKERLVVASLFVIFLILLLLNIPENAISKRFIEISDLQTFKYENSLQSGDSLKNGERYFTAIFRDSVLSEFVMYEKENGREFTEKDIGFDFSQNEMQMIIAKDSIINSYQSVDTVWSLDTVIEGRRCFAIIYSSRRFDSLKKKFPDNEIFINFPLNFENSRVFSGIIHFVTNKRGWTFNLRARE